eukprot:353880-Chlamydomonas_euryale.AAC.18
MRLVNRPLYSPRQPSRATVRRATSIMPVYLIGRPPAPCACSRVRISASGYDTTCTASAAATGVSNETACRR